MNTLPRDTDRHAAAVLLIQLLDAAEGADDFAFEAYCARLRNAMRDVPAPEQVEA